MTITDEFEEDGHHYCYLPRIDEADCDALIAFCNRSYAPGSWGFQFDPCTHLSHAIQLWFLDANDMMLLKLWLA
jgi:hypothetical protein